MACDAFWFLCYGVASLVPGSRGQRRTTHGREFTFEQGNIVFFDSGILYCCLLGAAWSSCEGEQQPPAEANRVPGRSDTVTAAQRSALCHLGRGLSLRRISASDESEARGHKLPTIGAWGG